MPRLEVESLLSLDLHLEHDLELPIVLFLTTVLNSIWKLRQPGNKVQKYLVRSELEAMINLLRETRYSHLEDRLEDLTISMFG